MALATILFPLLPAYCSHAPANCRDQVVAAYERLKTSGRPYRKETVIVGDNGQISEEVAEFVPPDRMREFTAHRGVPGGEADEMIRIGPRAWSNETGRWREWEPGDAELIYGESMDFSLLPDRIVTRAPEFDCLGRVDFKDWRYIGYRVHAPAGAAVILYGDFSGSKASEEERKKKVQELLEKATRMPPVHRTVLVHWPSMLPAFDLSAPENDLDHPRMMERYTYPDDIRIEPPR